MQQKNVEGGGKQAGKGRITSGLTGTGARSGRGKKKKQVPRRIPMSRLMEWMERGMSDVVIGFWVYMGWGHS